LGGLKPRATRWSGARRRNTRLACGEKEKIKKHSTLSLGNFKIQTASPKNRDTLDLRVSYYWNADQLSDRFRRMGITGYEM
jgi:hypothetical protein